MFACVVAILGCLQIVTPLELPSDAMPSAPVVVLEPSTAIDPQWGAMLPPIDSLVLPPQGFETAPGNNLYPPVAFETTYFDPARAQERSNAATSANALPSYVPTGYAQELPPPAGWESAPAAVIESPEGTAWTFQQGEPMQSSARAIPWSERRWSRLRHWMSRQSGPDLGLGYERVMFAPVAIDPAISTPHIGVRLQGENNRSTPDRLEYFWAKAGTGPGPERSVDSLDSILRMELGSSQAVAISEFRMRALDPEVNGNTVGFGDMVVGGKGTIFDGTCTKVATQFLTYLKTGPVQRGLGTGHVSLEPALLVRHQWNDATFLHAQVKYWIPISGTRNFAGDVLTTGWGLSTVWKETDRYALLPTLEFQTHSFLFGQETHSDGSIHRIDSKTAAEIIPGMRLALAKSSMGLWEIGCAGALAMADRDWPDSRWMIDLRLVR